MPEHWQTSHALAATFPALYPHHLLACIARVLLSVCCLLQVQRRADEVQKDLQGPLKALGDGIGSTADGIQKTFGVKLLQ